VAVVVSNVVVWVVVDTTVVAVDTEVLHLQWVHTTTMVLHQALIETTHLQEVSICQEAAHHQAQVTQAQEAATLQGVDTCQEVEVAICQEAVEVDTCQEVAHHQVQAIQVQEAAQVVTQAQEVITVHHLQEVQVVHLRVQAVLHQVQAVIMVWVVQVLISGMVLHLQETITEVEKTEVTLAVTETTIETDLQEDSDYQNSFSSCSNIAVNSSTFQFISLPIYQLKNPLNLFFINVKPIILSIVLHISYLISHISDFNFHISLSFSPNCNTFSFTAPILTAYSSSHTAASAYQHIIANDCRCKLHSAQEATRNSVSIHFISFHFTT
jgi:hypothetical protein